MHFMAKRPLSELDVALATTDAIIASVTNLKDDQVTLCAAAISHFR